MATGDTSNSDIVVLTADVKVASLPGIISFLVLGVIAAVGITFLFIGITIPGFVLAGSGLVLLVGGLIRTTTSTIFDFAQREITIKKVGQFRTTLQRMSFDMVQALYLPPGRNGAALRLKNGTTVKATDTPYNYIGLDHRLARVRARLGIGAAHPPSLATEVKRQTTTIPNGPLFFTASRQLGRLPGMILIFVGGAIGILPVLFGLWVVFSGSIDFLDAVGVILVLLVVVLCATFFVAMGLATFREVAELSLDSEARQAHFVLVWPIIWPNEVIAFEDLAAAGVRETAPTGSHGTHDLHPYIRLKSGRRIDLSGFGGTFGSAEEMASRICEITGAKLQNVHAFP